VEVERMPRKSPFKITLTSEERRILTERVRKYTLPYFNVVRAKMILLAADGLNNDEIATRLDIGRDVVSQWRKRFFELRVPGLEELPRSGRPRVFSPRGRRAG
jgi:hypothetical protein